MTRPQDLGVQLYAVRDALAADMPGTIERLAAIGFGYVEPFGLLADPAGLDAALRANGLRAITAHAPVNGPDALRPVRGGDVARHRDPRSSHGWTPSGSPPATRSGVSPTSSTARPQRSPGTGSRWAITTTGSSSRRSSTAGPPWSGSPTTSTTASCSRSTPTGRRSAGRTCRRCSAGWATGCGSSTSRTARSSRASPRSRSGGASCRSGRSWPPRRRSSSRSSSSTHSTATCSTRCEDSVAFLTGLP